METYFRHGALSRTAFQSYLTRFGGDEKKGFTQLVIPIVERFCEQTNRKPMSEKVISQFCGVVWDVSCERGIPQPDDEKKQAEPEELDPDELAELMAEVLDRLDFPDIRMELAVLSSHLLRTVLRIDFMRCRLSYCEKNDAGMCERQSLRHCMKRISGAHCVDCPLFILTSPAKHPRVLKSQWDKSHYDELEANLNAFLPEDFRQLSYFLFLQRRYTESRAPAADE